MGCGASKRPADVKSFEGLGIQEPKALPPATGSDKLPKEDQASNGASTPVGILKKVPTPHWDGQGKKQVLPPVGIEGDVVALGEPVQKQAGHSSDVGGSSRGGGEKEVKEIERNRVVGVPSTPDPFVAPAGAVDAVKSQVLS
eukprot:CAMPEP_0182906852 /NCGR_PEP_ID=MMETSP0034_2-20130328/34057_1 /TAXON_ID=156128 /ORGANISM="Nephroselmis pyriformis, Strain CCMP717" /LENGTH=141 /DNA_ID=CAMNT_0025042637 /DNA_START=136 /DNA_END=558 /DNA_ORIENTATION=-